MSFVLGGTFVAFIIIGIANMGAADKFEKIFKRNAFHLLVLPVFFILFVAFANSINAFSNSILLQLGSLLALGGLFMLYKKQYGTKYALTVMGYTLVFTVGALIIAHLIKGVIDSILNNRR
jgi:hypothetical protein